MIELKNQKPRLYVDMDGTLAYFKTIDKIERLYEENYFLSLKPIKGVVEAIRDMVNCNKDVDVFILSSYLTDSQFALKEKNLWLDMYLPEISRENRVFVPYGEDKNHFINNLGHTDYLLDDYSKNLTLWEPPAVGIKLLNGINHTHGTWKGNCISCDGNIRAKIEKIIAGDKVIEAKPKVVKEIHELGTNIDNNVKEIITNRNIRSISWKDTNDVDKMLVREESDKHFVYIEKKANSFKTITVPCDANVVKNLLTKDVYKNLEVEIVKKNQIKVEKEIEINEED